MKSFSVSIFYILYLAAALCLYPVKLETVHSNQTGTETQVVEVKTADANNNELLHGELLFQNADF